MQYLVVLSVLADRFGLSLVTIVLVVLTRNFCVRLMERFRNNRSKER